MEVEASQDQAEKTVCNYQEESKRNVDEELLHFSHEHPLILSEGKKDDGKKVTCRGCWQKISGSAFSCKECPFFMHKLCAFLPPKIQHPMHSDHLLSLLPKAPYPDSKFKCDACHENWEAFAYHCSLCNFNLNISCALREVPFELKCHSHPLRAVLRPASFECHACGAKHEGESFMCTICEFWIHEECVLLPKTVKKRFHPHPLSLAYSFPVEQFIFHGYSCGICEDKLNRSCWIYQCRGCNYFAHVKCLRTTKEPSMDTENELKSRLYSIIDGFKLIHLPPPDESIDLFSQFIREISLETKPINNIEGARSSHFGFLAQSVKRVILRENKTEEKQPQFNHEHSLTLFDGQKVQMKDKICDACIQPISTPFYNCEQCAGFSIHKWCAELPNKLWHPCHSHQLTLGKRREMFGFFICHGCKNICNGLSFQCAQCKDYFLDIKCASLPSSIMHNTHKHHLPIKNDCLQEGCTACYERDSIFSFGCSACNFNLHYRCALLPSTFNHRYDKHPFILTHSPIDDGPVEYFCELCEEEIDPVCWFYHCIHCDQSVCAKCLNKAELSPNVKWGKTYEFDTHPHLLTLVQPANRSPSCGRCCRDFSSHRTAFKCFECNILLHPECAWPSLRFLR